MKHTLISAKTVGIFLGLLSLNGCVDLNDPYTNSGYGSGYGSGGYNSGYGYGSGYDNRRDRHLERERRQLDRERDRVEDERRRLEWQRSEEYRRRAEDARRQADSQRRVDRCPPGFSPSEQKCSNEERRRGCKDMRMPGGLGCVRR